MSALDQHTPGPWKVWREWPDRDPDIPRRFHIHTGDASNPADPEYRRIAQTTDMPEHVAKANARLIAAAPALKDAIIDRAKKEAVEFDDGEDEWRAYLTEKEEAALAQVEGSDRA